MYHFFGFNNIVFQVIKFLFNNFRISLFNSGLHQFLQLTELNIGRLISFAFDCFKQSGNFLLNLNANFGIIQSVTCVFDKSVYAVRIRPDTCTGKTLTICRFNIRSPEQKTYQSTARKRNKRLFRK